MGTNLRCVKRGYADIGDGLQMYYETMGDGYPLILLHQSWWNNFEFEKVIPLLAKQYTVYSPIPSVSGFLRQHLNGGNSPILQMPLSDSWTL